LLPSCDLSTEPADKYAFAEGADMSMTLPDFEKSMREFADQVPFQPFLIEFDDGEQLLVPSRQAIGLIGGDDAIYFGPDRQDLRFVDCDSVKRIVAASPAGSV
jgi:hypothetical protein